MILTLTPNPTIDRAIFVRDFYLGGVVRAEREVVTPSGKGVDASLVIHELGGETVALGLNAGHTGRLLAAMLDEWGVAHDFCPACGETRMAVVLIDLALGRQSTITAPTLWATADHLGHLLARLDAYAGQAGGLICAGSLPPPHEGAGLPGDTYTHLLRHARCLGWVTLLDTSGAALCHGVAGRPDVLKINVDELAALDPALSGAAALPPAGLARLLEPFYARWVEQALVVTLGVRGALALTGDGVYWAQPPTVPVVNTAGAGDALNGGLVLARCRGEAWPAALALGTAAAAAVVTNEGTAICHREQVMALLPQVRIQRLDRDPIESVACQVKESNCDQRQAL